MDGVRQADPFQRAAVTTALPVLPGKVSVPVDHTLFPAVPPSAVTQNPTWDEDHLLPFQCHSLVLQVVLLPWLLRD
jgi:hypothetical protein